MADPGRTPAPARVAAVVLNWRLVDATLDLLADLVAANREGPAVDVLVIDNGSGDGSAESLHIAVAAANAELSPGESAHHEVLALPDNVGYCAAINRGIAWARERAVRAGEVPIEYVLLLNNDVRLPADFLRPLLTTLDNDASLAAVGPTVVDPRGRAWSQGGGVAFRPNLVVLHNQGGEPAATDRGPREVEFLPGACALYRLAALEELEGLDEAYFMYWEDVDLGARLRARGERLVWLPWVRIVHDVSRSSGGGRSPLRKYMMAVNSVRYLRRHGRPSDWFGFVLFECLLWPLTFLSGTSPRAAWAKGRGLVAGLLGRRVTVADVERWTKRRPV